MTNSTSNYDQLIQKLDAFIRKYYVNQLIRGFLYTVGVVFAFFILINVLEYFFYFGKSMRKFLFFSFVGTSLASIIYKCLFVFDILIFNRVFIFYFNFFL